MILLVQHLVMLDTHSNGCTGEGSINLAEAALHVAAEDDALVSHGSVQLPLQPYQQRIQRLASDIAARLERLGPMASDRQPEAVLQASTGACSHCLLHTCRDSQSWGGWPTKTTAGCWTGSLKQDSRWAAGACPQGQAVPIPQNMAFAEACGQQALFVCTRQLMACDCRLLATSCGRSADFTCPAPACQLMPSSIILASGKVRAI